MARRARGTEDFAAEVAKLRLLLDDFLTRVAHDDLREQVQSLVPAFHSIRSLGIALMPPETATSAPERIIAYLQRYPMTLIDGDELLVVSGIGEWARRVRELRVETGWWIYSGMTIREQARADPEAASELLAKLGVNEPDAIKVDQYVLVRPEQDREAAHRWNSLNRVRNLPGAAKTKMLTFLRENVGHSVSLEELRYVSKNASDWARRIRELRTEEGWPVFSRMQGRPDLPVGTYILDEDKQAPEHDRHIPDDVRVAVLTRDHFACRHCGWSRGDASADDPRKSLELHHRTAHKDKGENSVENLVTLCNVDHDSVHAGRLTLNL